MNKNKMNFKKSLILLGIAISLPYSEVFATESTIIEQEFTVPTCYERSNTALPRALTVTEMKALHECKEGTAAFEIPVTLLNVEVKINQASPRQPCGNVTVKAQYLCQK